MSAPIEIHSRVSMPRSSFRYPRILFITASPFSLTASWGEENMFTTSFLPPALSARLLSPPFPPPSLESPLLRPPSRPRTPPPPTQDPPRPSLAPDPEPHRPPP